MYKVEKNVPMPTYSGKKGVSKYPFKEMEVGDSFEFKGSKPTIDAAVNRFSKILDYKFTVRKVENGFRIWRTK